MKYFILSILLIMVTCSHEIKAQKISTQGYNRDYIHEDFNSESETFKVVTTTDNYFIFDRGDYLLSRNNNESEYAVIAKNSNVSDFILKTSIRIGPSENRKASIGIILKAQSDGQNAIIFEINKKGEYRIKKLVGNTYQTLSGNNNDGWIKSKLIKQVDQQNFIEIRSEKNIYDVYTNSRYLTTFFIPDLKSGSCGLIISPETKARVSYFYINTKGKNTQKAQYNYENFADKNVSNEETNSKIKILEENNVKLIQLNKELQSENENISKLNNINAIHKSDLEIKNKEIQELNQTINTKKIELNRLKKENVNLTSISLELEKENKTLQNLVNDVRVAENEVSATNNQLNKKITILEQEMSNKKLDNKQLANDLNNLRQSSEKTITQLNNKLNELEKSKLNLTKKIGALETNLLSEKKDKDDITNSFSDLSKSSNAIIDKLNNKINELKGKNNDLTKTNKSLSEELLSKNEVNNTNKKNNEALSKSITTYKEEIKTLKYQLKESENTISNLTTTQEQHNNVTKDLDAKINDLSDRIKVLTNYLNTANDNNKVLKATNEELKELFILKDFEINGVKPSELIKKTPSTLTTPKVLTGNKTIYTVQFGVFMQKQNHTSTKDIDNIWYENTKQGTFIYYSGEFNLPQEAAIHMNKLISKGYRNAFVVTKTK